MELQLNRSRLNMYSLSTLQNSFDETKTNQVQTDLLEDEQERSCRIHQRLENKWLGSLSIPFSSLYQNTRVEGTFRLHSPPVLLGYERLGPSVDHTWRPQVKLLKTLVGR